MAKTNLNNVAGELSILLADTYALALKTQNYHWNVTGMEFYSLHKLFEEQYEALHNAADELAERIRALGSFSPGSFGEFSKLTNIPEPKKNANSKAMLEDLIKSHETLVKQAKKVIDVSEKADDSSTADIVIGRIEEHQKIIWMLNSSSK
ncbi:MAG: Ferritin Dps family protein [Rickettsiaceae bacterium]|jgi:starvation-inducible DNA-binding protein|nr:Ferritin Dps family protein [Rickettsiaceae bacterium]